MVRPQQALASDPQQGAVETISCRGISHWFDGLDGRSLPVLDQVDLSIRAHSFVSLFGPSGCGKTTLLRIIHGLITPAQGEVWINGHVVRGPTSDRAMVFQEHNLLPWKTALENVEFGCKLVGISVSERRERAEEALALTGLRDFANYYPSQLSGGMKQRVGLARALALSPAVLLMDEPFGALDMQTREMMQAELVRLWETDRKTVVFVTHSVDEAILLSDQVVVMSHRPGKVKAVFDIGLSRPRNEATREDPNWTLYRRQLWQLLKPELTDL